MTFSREDYDHLIESGRTDIVRHQRPIFEAARRAALSAKYVTGDSYWDEFLSMLQARLEEVTAKRDEALRRFQDDNKIDPDELLDQKLAVRLFGRDIETLEYVLGLPKVLMEQGAQAGELLKNTDKTAH